MQFRLPLAVVFLLLTYNIQASTAITLSNSPVPYYLKVENFVRITAGDFEKASGHKLSILQRTYFRKLQRQLSKTNYNSESNILNYYDTQSGKFKLDPLWFVLGCFIGPFAVLFSFTTRSKQTKSKRISALIGFGVFILWFGWLFLF